MNVCRRFSAKFFENDGRYTNNQFFVFGYHVMAPPPPTLFDNQGKSAFISAPRGRLAINQSRDQTRVQKCFPHWR